MTDLYEKIFIFTIIFIVLLLLIFPANISINSYSDFSPLPGIDKLVTLFNYVMSIIVHILATIITLVNDSPSAFKSVFLTLIVFNLIIFIKFIVKP